MTGEARILLGVEVDVTGELLTLKAGERIVARWSLDEINVSCLADGFHINGVDDEAVLSVTDPMRLASELGVGAGRPTRWGRAGQATGWRQRFPRMAATLSIVS